MSKSLELKVCGMREPQNIDAVAEWQPDYLGFIFYPPSSRYVKRADNQAYIASLDTRVKKVGVFVNAPLEEVVREYKNYRLDLVQLHGSESPEYCKELKNRGIALIKVFPIEDKLDMELMRPYKHEVSFFLLDTKTPQHGGSGRKFNWDLLRGYSLEVPILLSGGIQPEDIDRIMELEIPQLAGIDVNSGFEIQPGLKNVKLIEELKKNLKKHN